MSSADSTEGAASEETLPPSGGVEVHAPPLSGMRAWFAGFVLWMVGLTAVALLALSRFEQGQVVAGQIWLLAFLCFYISLCNVFLPLPTAWIVLYAASDEAGLCQWPWLRVGLVAGVATLATVVANLNEYHILAFLFERGLSGRLRRTRVYQWAVRWFDRAPFQTLTLIGFIPIPIDAIRWLAVLRQYSRLRFAAAYFIGRAGRYLLLAWLAVAASFTGGQILTIQLAIIVIAVTSRILWRTAARSTARAVPLPLV